jgi:hypothetical protein
VPSRATTEAVQFVLTVLFYGLKNATAWSVNGTRDSNGGECEHYRGPPEEKPLSASILSRVLV